MRGREGRVKTQTFFFLKLQRLLARFFETVKPSKVTRKTRMIYPEFLPPRIFMIER